MVNSGEIDWEDDVQLVKQPSATDYESTVAKLEPGTKVAPGQKHTFEVTVTAPNCPGLVLGTFALCGGDGKPFGQTASWTFTATKSLQESMNEEALLLLNRDKSMGDSANAADKSLGDSDHDIKEPAQPQPAAMDVSVQSQMANPYVAMIPQQKEIQSPKQIYSSRVKMDTTLSAKVVEGMNALFEMGFVEYDINLTLMLRYNDYGAAAEHLCTYGTEGIKRSK